MTLPVLQRIWPAGLDSLEQHDRGRLRTEHAHWLGASNGHRRWIDYVMRDLLGWAGLFSEGPFPALDITEHDERVQADFALVEPDGTGFGLLGLVLPPGTDPARRPDESTWAATWTDRLIRLLSEERVHLGLLTSGRWWTIVYVPESGRSVWATFDATIWTEELDIARAFRSLLGRRRLISVPVQETLPALLDECRDQPEMLTDALGTQVRKAVELLIHAIGQCDRHHVITDVELAYRGAVTIMMRLLFILFAEERGLLPLTNGDYAANYSATRLVDELRTREVDEGADALAQTHTAWCRLLAVARALHWGVAAADLPIRAYDGGLFDPRTYTWMEDSGAGEVLPIDDLTMLRVLEAMQFVTVQGDLRRVSFASLEIEEIGHAYERLLDFTAHRATKEMVGLIGRFGFEETVSVEELEEHAQAASGDAEHLAGRLKAAYGRFGIGGVVTLRRLLVPPEGQEREQALRLLLAATDGDRELAERLLPFHRLIRTDLRDLPLVVMPGGFYTSGVRQGGVGTYYTPKELADEVVLDALKPLVFSPGPLQTADKSAWQPRSSTEILGLRIADIACGSGAFLVAACRYLAERLVEAWAREGGDGPSQVTPPAADPDADPTLVKARFLIITRCLYGADIDPLSVQMARLSLWLLQPTTPFAFLDDRIVCGDSLLGITSLEQVEWMHVDPERGRRMHKGKPWAFTSGLRQIAEKAALRRRELRDLPPDNLVDLEAKHHMHDEAKETVEVAEICADLVVGAALVGAKHHAVGIDRKSLHAADLARLLADAEGERPEVQRQARTWLCEGLHGLEERRPLHWPLEFPEVFLEGGGFDAVVGNPPFLGGQKITGVLGQAYREHLVEAVGRGARGSADLCAYFVLRAHALINEDGQTGLIATNTLGQGDTREVGLDQIVADGVTIRRAFRSRPWPSKSAVLEFSTIWTSRAALGDTAEIILDGRLVGGITPGLAAWVRVGGKPSRLVANSGMSFIGSYVLGLGFTMEPAAASAMIAGDPRNEEVLFPYLNGQDLNSRPDHSGSRWVINFHHWDVDQAKTYTEPYEQVLRLVKPERDKNKRTARRVRWWLYAERAPTLVEAVKGLERVIALTRVSKVVMPVMVSTGQVISEAVVVFAMDDTAMLALLSSAPHYWWTRARASTMKTDLRYTPSDVFETLALPEFNDEMRELGNRLDTFRSDLMLSRQAGLTATYNLVNNPGNADDDIIELRSIHQAIDEAVCRAYHWDDLIDQLGHGHHLVGREIRYTLGPAVQQEVLDRLLELNRMRHQEERDAHERRTPPLFQVDE